MFTATFETFEVGQVYVCKWETDVVVRVTRRAKKTVWLELVSDDSRDAKRYPEIKSLVSSDRPVDCESACFYGWYVCAKGKQT